MSTIAPHDSPRPVAVPAKVFYVDDGVARAAVVRADKPSIAQRYMACEELGEVPEDWIARKIDEHRARLIHAALAAGEWQGWPALDAQGMRQFWIDLESRVVPSAASVIPIIANALVTVMPSGDLIGWQVGA